MDKFFVIGLQKIARSFYPYGNAHRLDILSDSIKQFDFFRESFFYKF